MLIMEIQERISLLLKTKQIPQVVLSKHFNVSIQTVNQWTKPGKSVGLEVVKKLLDYFPDLNARWLILGTGEMFESEAQNENELTTIIDSRVEEILKKYNLTKK